MIIGDPKPMKSPALFRAMGRFIDSLGGRYITAEDMNIGIPDLEIVRRRRAGSRASRASRAARATRARTPRCGCLHGMRAVLEEVFGSADFAGKRVLIQGVGAVGGRLAVLLKEQGAQRRSSATSTRSASSELREQARLRGRARRDAPRRRRATSTRPARAARRSTTRRSRSCAARPSPAAPTTSCSSRATRDDLRERGHPLRARLRDQRGRDHQRRRRAPAGRLRREDVARARSRASTAP